MTYATTFSGIDGWAYGLNACGWQLQWACECDPFCQAVHRKRFGVPIYPDIGTLHVANPPKVDALIGSPPCPPFSVAGKKLGTSDTRHLYPAFIAAVRVLEPRWVLMEQVAGILSDRRAFGEYLGGLVALGYCVLWSCIPACSVGAPHRRDRVWIIARSMANAASGWRRQQLRADSEGQALPETFGQESALGIGSGDETLGDSEGINRRLLLQPRGPRKSSAESERASQTLEHPENHGKPRDKLSAKGHQPGGPIVVHAKGQHSRGLSIGEEPQESGHGNRSNPLDHWRDAQAVQGADGSVRIIKPGLPLLVNGIPKRVERIRSTGNAVVTAIPYLIGQAINEIEKEFIRGWR